jgi:NADH:ubiquinone oxidoreductase subunit E
MEADKYNLDVLQEVSINDKNEIDSILKSYKHERENVISILQEIQERFGYLPSNFVIYISKKLKIPAAEIYSIATFYSQFSFQKRGKYIIICCDGTACHVKGGPLILNFVENKLDIKSGETTDDLMFSIESVACLGCCAISPVCVINGQIFGGLTLKRMNNILQKLMKKSQVNE